MMATDKPLKCWTSHPAGKADPINLVYRLYQKKHRRVLRKKKKKEKKLKPSTYMHTKEKWNNKTIIYPTSTEVKLHIQYSSVLNGRLC